MAATYSSFRWERFRKNGPLLWTRRWSELDERCEEVQRKGLLFISHGLGEHTEYYEELAVLMSDHGFAVFSHDHVGQGESHGIHNHIENFKEYTEPIFDHCEAMRKRHTSLPLFVFGHSMGGTIAILAALERPTYFDGIITSAPLVIPTKGFPSKHKMFYLKCVTAKLHPERVLSDIDPTEITRDPAQIKKFTEDLLFRTPIKARWTKAWHNAACEILHNLKSVTWPFLAIHGDADQISDVKFSQKMFDKARSQDKELKIYPGFFHAPLYEPEEDRKQVLNDIKLWLEKRMKID